MTSQLKGHSGRAMLQWGHDHEAVETAAPATCGYGRTYATVFERWVDSEVFPYNRSHSSKRKSLSAKDFERWPRFRDHSTARSRAGGTAQS